MIDYTQPLDQLPDPLPIEPLSKPFDVTITPPGSKSITCRAYVLAALADGESKIIRPLRADDTDKLLDALCTLGAEARWDDEDVYIKGVDGQFPRGGEVNLGDGGAPTRFMIACACLAAEPVVVDGSERMRERPISEGVDMLRKLGAKIEYVQEDGRLPVRVVPSEDFKGGEIEIGTTTSSQFISALMLIGSCLRNGVTLRYLSKVTSHSYVSMTYRMMLNWTISIRHAREKDADLEHRVRPCTIQCRIYTVEPDASSAVYWWVAASIVEKGVVRIPNIPRDSCQPDVAVLSRHVIDMPAEVQRGVRWKDGSVQVCGKIDLILFDCSAERMPDASIALAAAAVEAKHDLEAFESYGLSAQSIIETFKLPSIDATRLTGLHTLRHKETDRIAALANELRRIGCTIETTDDSITIDPSTRHDEPVVIETYNDHRMAMSFAVLGLARPGISVKDPACVSKSYPTFWQDFAKLYK